MSVDIDARLRLKTKEARKAIADVGKKQKPVVIPVDYQAGKISKDFAILTSETISKRLATTFEESGDMIASKIESSIKKAKIKASGGGLIKGLLSTVTSVATAPLAAIARGGFEGVGREVSQKLGRGIAKGFDNQASQFIGSFDFFSESLVNRFLPKLGNDLISKLKDLPLGEELQKAISDFDTSEGREKLKEKIAELLGDSDLLVEKEFSKAQSEGAKQNKVNVAQKSVASEFQAGIGANQDVSGAQSKLGQLGVDISAINFVDAIANKNIKALEKLKATIDKSSAQLESDLQRAQSILRDRVSKLAQANELKELAVSSGNDKIAQSATAKINAYEKDVVAIKKIILDKTFDLESLKARAASIPDDIGQVGRDSIEDKLGAQAEVVAKVLNRNQAEVFNELVESQLASNRKTLNNLDAGLQNALAPLKNAIAAGEKVDTSQLKTDAEAIAQTEVGRKIKVQKRIANRVKVLREKQKELIKISNDPDDEVLATLNEKLAGYEGLLAGVNIDIKGILASDSELASKVNSVSSRKNIIKESEEAKSNLPKLQEKLQQERDQIESELRANNQVLEKLSQKVDSQPVTAKVDVPQVKQPDVSAVAEKATQSKVQVLVNAVAKEVERLSARTIDNIPEGVAAFDLPAGLEGAFRGNENQIALQPSIVEAINQGNISREVIELIAHELRHVVQLAEGEIQDLVSGNFLLTPTESELKKIGSSIEASTQSGTLPGFGKDEIRKIEADAYTFALRYTEEIAQNINGLLVDNTKQIRDVLAKIQPIELPKTPAISSRAFPAVESSNDLEILLNQQMSASGLKEIVKRLGLGTDSPVKKVAIERIVNSYKQDAIKVQELIGRLGDDIKLKAAKNGVGSSLGSIEDEPALKEALKSNRAVLSEAFNQLENVSGDQRQELATQIKEIARSQIETIDRVAREFKVAGKTGQSLSGSRSQFAAIFDFEAIKARSQQLQETMSSLGTIEATDALKTITKIEPELSAFLASVKTLDRTDETEKVRQQLESQLKAIKTAKKLSLEAVEFDYKELLSNPGEYVNILKDSAIAKSKQGIKEVAEGTAKKVTNKVSQTVENILENTKQKIAEGLQQIERAALPEQQAKAALPAAKTGEITKVSSGQLSTQKQVVNTVSSLAVRAIADITATSKSGFEAAKALEKLAFDLVPFAQVAKTGIQTAAPVIAGGAIISQSPEIATAAKFAAENLADVIQPLIAALRAGGANAVGDLVGQIPGIGGVSQAVIKGLLNNPAFNAQIAEGLANVTTVAGIGAGAIKGGKAAVSKASEQAFKALPESLQDRLTPESITAFDTLVAQRQKEINLLAKDIQSNVKSISATQNPAEAQNLLAGYNQVTQQIEELEKFSVKAGIEVLKRTKDRLAQLKRVQSNLKGAIPDVSVEQVIAGESSNLKNVTGNIELGGVIGDRTTDIVNSVAQAVEAEIADTVVATIGNIVKSPTGRELGKEATVNAVGFVAGKTASAASGGVPGIGLATELGASTVTRKAVTDVESTLDALAIVLHNGAGETESKLELFQRVLETAASEARRKSSVVKNDLDQDVAGFSIGNIAATVSQQAGAEIPLIGAATAIATTKSAIKVRNAILDAIDAKALVNEIAEGIKVGVAQNIATVVASGARLGSHLEQSFKDSLGIRSPAKNFIRDIGFVALGIASGVEHHLKTIGKDGKKLGDVLLGGFAQTAVEQADAATQEIIGRIEQNLERADNAANRVERNTNNLENRPSRSRPLSLAQRRARHEGNKVATEAQTLLDQLKTIIIVGKGANQKLKDARRATENLQKERAALLREATKVRGEEKLKIVAQVEQIDARIEQEVIRAKALVEEREQAKKLLPEYKQLSKLNRQLQAAIARNDGRAIRRLRTDIDNVHRSLGRTPPARSGLLGSIQTQLEGIGVTSQNVVRGLKGLAALAVGSLFVGGFDDVLRNAAQTRMRFEQLENQIDFASGSAKAGASNFAFAAKEARRLNVDIEQAITGYASLSAATKTNDTLRGETQRIFKVISQASRVTGSTAQQTEAVFLAIQQMVSGGTLQLEELRQLGESGGIKGVFDIAQNALGAADGELRKLISTGTIAVNDFLPAFIDELDRVTRSGVAESLNTTTAALTRVTNEFKLLQNEIGALSEDAAKTALKGMATSLELVRENLHIVVPMLKTVAVLVGAALLPSLVAVSKIVGGFLLTGLQKTVIAVVELNGGLTLTNLQLALLTASTVAFAAGAVVVVSQVTQAFFNLREAGKEARNAVLGIEDAIRGLDKAQAKNSILGGKSIAELNIKRLRESRNLIQKGVDQVFGGIFTTYVDAAISRTEAATGEAISVNQRLLARADQELGIGDVSEKSTRDLKDFANALDIASSELNTTLDNAVNPEQIKKLNLELAENEKRLKIYNSELQRRGDLELNLAKIVVARDEKITDASVEETEAIASINSDILKSGDFKQDVELQKLKFTEARLSKELKAEKVALEQIRELAANGKGIDAKTGKPRNADEFKEFEKTEKRINELTRSSIENRQSLLAKEVEQKIAEYDRYLDEIETRRQQAEDDSIQSEKERLIEIQKLVNADILTTEAAEKLKANLSRDRLTSELEEEKKKLRQLKKFKSREVEAQEKADNDVKASKSKILELTLSLLEQEKAAEESAIETIAEARGDLFSQLEKRLNRLNQIQQTQSGLVRDRAAAEEKLQQLQVSKLRQALELRRQLNGSDLDINERRTLIRQLTSLGVKGKTSELALLDKIKKEEAEIATNKLENLKIQQKFAQQQLEIENQQLILATKKDAIEARKARNEAEKAVNDAEAAIATAETPEELKEAQELYDLAIASLKIAKEDAELVAEQQAGLSEVIAKKQELLNLNQAIARAELSGNTLDQEFEQEKERNKALESRDRRLGRNLDKYITIQESIESEIENARESQGNKFNQEEEDKLRKSLAAQSRVTERSREQAIRRDLLGSDGFTIDAAPEVLDLIRNGKSFLVPSVPSTRSAVPLETGNFNQTKGKLDENNLILNTLKNIESKFKQPTVIQVQNDNQFTNVYDNSSADEIPRKVRSELTSMFNQLESSLLLDN